MRRWNARIHHRQRNAGRAERRLCRKRIGCRSCTGYKMECFGVPGLIAAGLRRAWPRTYSAYPFHGSASARQAFLRTEEVQNNAEINTAVASVAAQA